MKGGATQVKVHFKGQDDDFLVFVDDLETYKKWQEDKSVPLAHFVSAFKIFVTHNQGAQGAYDSAPKGQLESEFGTSNEDEVIKAILEKGSVQESSLPERQAPKNDSKGPMVAH
ncbi:putative shwachman-bodian-diamond syndrome protein [Diaporthe ampelina]|uniref:Putative shwachman-bodian-diamond syndrome protein n=1 Tax=Diaporthe ampelina TaxID=1214573 RepID=A0A0G2FS71_9PEZI|nr:putative shwachman-bodian-diamond syndrome protein [Diaporthe ampelina]